MKEKPELLKLYKFLPFIATVANNQYALVLFDASGNSVTIETETAASNSFTDQLPKLLEQIKVDWYSFSNQQDFLQISPQVAPISIIFSTGSEPKAFLPVPDCSARFVGYGTATICHLAKQY